MIEGEFGMVPPEAKPNANGLPNVVVGRHMEERIRKRAELDARLESGELRVVSLHNMFTFGLNRLLIYDTVLCHSRHRTHSAGRPAQSREMGCSAVAGRAAPPEETVVLEWALPVRR
jgi:hypothetical protein